MVVKRVPKNFIGPLQQGTVRGDEVGLDPSGRPTSISPDVARQQIVRTVSGGRGGGGGRSSNLPVSSMSSAQKITPQGTKKTATPTSQQPKETRTSRFFGRVERGTEADIQRIRAERERLKNEAIARRQTGFKAYKSFEGASRELTSGALTLAQSGLSGIQSVGSLAYVGGSFIVRGVKNLKNLPKENQKLIKKIISNPNNVAKVVGRGITKKGKQAINFAKGVPKQIKTGTKNAWEVAKVSPTTAIAVVGKEVFLLGVTSKGLKVTGKLTSKGRTLASPSFKEFRAGKIVIRKEAEETFLRKGEKVFLKERVKKPKTFIGKTTQKITGRKAGQFKKFQKRGLTLREGTVQSSRMTLKEQVGLAGKRIPVATSVQRNRLVTALRRNNIVRKPIDNEAKFSATTKRLLERFDKGQIKSIKEIRNLNSRVKKETRKLGGLQRDLLERSTYFSPSGTIRTSRLGEELGDASLRDILRGNFTLRGQKPQIIVMEDVDVAKFPKSLADVKKVLQKNGKLTEKQKERLVLWQIKKSGRVKPVGDTLFAGGIESEVTIAPKEIIKRTKKLGVTLIDGKRVEIISAKIVKPKKTTKKLIEKFNRRTITKKELSTLKRNLKKETGLKVEVPSRIKERIRRLGGRRGRRVIREKKPLRLGRRGTAFVSRRIRRRGRRLTGKGRPRPSPRVRGKPRPPTRPRPSPRGGGGRTGRGGRRPVVLRKTGKTGRPLRIGRTIKTGKTAKTIPIRKKGIRRIMKKKVATGYNVYARPLKSSKKGRIPKLIKINKVPLTRSRAEDYRNYLLDTSLSRTGQIVSGSGKPQRGKLRVPIGYGKRTSFKFRSYKIRKGRAKQLARDKVIERSKRLLDTRQEKRGITLRRRLKQLSPRRMKRRSKK